MSAARLGESGRLLGEFERVFAAPLSGGDVDQADQVRGYAGLETKLSPQPGRLLQPLPRRVQAAGPVLREFSSSGPRFSVRSAQ